ncbi:hypothetical protein [Microcella humidisoli]|uniref:Uncharacterized protein n=1 Tax=Microcella humidisoli TaxID=2963406 RepID=A0ABY5FYF0_9MICO|nr:hypothetical protein [Microcella humidisoli]UTT63314.1 hypothetical protein NNL39_04215 [Microcella humidisoli]
MAELPDTWWGWSLSNALSAAQLLFTVLGFVATVIALVANRSAVKEGTQATQSLRETFQVRRVAELVGALHALEESVDDQIRIRDRDATGAALLDYANRADRSTALLRELEDEASRRLADALESASLTARRAKDSLARNKREPVQDLTRTASEKITEAGQLAAQYLELNAWKGP